MCIGGPSAVVPRISPGDDRIHTCRNAKDTEVAHLRPHLHEVSPLLVGSTHLVALVGSPLLVGDATTVTDTCMLISIDVCVCMGCNVCS